MPAINSGQMKIVFFTHPDFLNHQSMPRFAKMLMNGMKERGHDVSSWTPNPFFFIRSFPPSLKKWLSYIDQYIVFPLIVKMRLKKCDPDTLFVCTDQALGPWVPLIKDRLHVIHCHDFLALRSSLDLIVENKISWSGKIYQKYIRRGFSKGKNFISVSNKTKDDLHKFIIGNRPEISEVVYNGLNQKFSIQDSNYIRKQLTAAFNIDLNEGYILHVGGNLWYKNRRGVIQIYNAWRKTASYSLPLILIGEQPDTELNEEYEHSEFKKDIHFLTQVSDEQLRMAYSGAHVFLFPSYAEGFGWPIAEAMASGCLVITTNEAPMTEVGGDAAFYISKKGNSVSEEKWAQDSARILNEIVTMPLERRTSAVRSGIANVQRFDPVLTMDLIERIYKNIADAEK